jgi:hypothetical protein
LSILHSHHGCINGVHFSFTTNGVPSTDAVIDGGPGATNNLTTPVVEGTTAGVLSLSFASPETRFGFGYAVHTFAPLPDATTVRLFDASNNLVGVVSANGSPDPIITGGFLGVMSDVPFVRADVTFNQAGQRFAFDNVRVAFAPQDLILASEPPSLALFGICAGGSGVYYWRRRAVAC